MSEAPTSGQEALHARLVREPRLFDFIAAVRLIEGDSPRAPIGQLGPIEEERVRLRPLLDLAFPGADVASIVRDKNAEEQQRFALSITFLGLYGPSSPLPNYFTESLMTMEDQALVRGFIDIFHHRFISLFYRALTKYRIECASPSVDILALCGQAGAHGGRNFMACAGLLAQQPHSASSLSAALSTWFGGIAIAVEQCWPCWTEIPTAQLARLAVANCALGRDCMLGNRVYNSCSSFRICVGPLSAERFSDFLPGGRATADLQLLVAEFNTERLDYVVDLLVSQEGLPARQLGKQPQRLGWDARLSGAMPEPYCVRFPLSA